MTLARYAVLFAVNVGLPGALQRNLVVRERTRFCHGRSLGLRIGLGLRRRLRDLMDVGWMNVADWIDHFDGLLRDRIGRASATFNVSDGRQNLR